MESETDEWKNAEREKKTDEKKKRLDGGKIAIKFRFRGKRRE